MVETELHLELADEAFRFEFFQAVRLLEKIYSDRAPVGRDALPAREIVRFRSRATLDFPAGEVHELRETEDPVTGESQLEMIINFMGMIGPTGVLPTHYTELAMERARYRDTSFYAFVDIFTHRAVSLFFRAWEKYRFPIQYERGSDDFTADLFDFAGLGTTGLRGRMNLDDESLLPYAGLMAQRPHSASSLENILSDYYNVSAKVTQFTGQWLNLDDESITRLGQANSTLGESTVTGTRVWDDQSGFRVGFGPLTFAQFQAFLPNGSGYKPMRAMIRFMVGDELDFDVQLKLKAKEVPSTILTTRAKRRPMLGWSSYLKTKPFRQDDEQVILQAA
jgi:type VI secretion system protein ImpH